MRCWCCYYYGRHSRCLTATTLYATTIGDSNTTFAGDGSSLTGIAVTSDINTNNIAISGIATVGTSITMRESAINVTGVITATSFVGDGSDLTGITIPAGTDWRDSSLF